MATTRTRIYQSQPVQEGTPQEGQPRGFLGIQLLISRFEEYDAQTKEVCTKARTVLCSEFSATRRREQETRHFVELFRKEDVSLDTQSE